MGVFDAYTGLRLRGGFVLGKIKIEPEPMLDALGRPALARTAIIGTTLSIDLADGLEADELSITLYHEVLEAASVAAMRPPARVCELNEAGFEAAAQQMHKRFGLASPSTLDQMLELFGF